MSSGRRLRRHRRHRERCCGRGRGRGRAARGGDGGSKWKYCTAIVPTSPSPFVGRACGDKVRAHCSVEFYFYSHHCIHGWGARALNFFTPAQRSWIFASGVA